MGGHRLRQIREHLGLTLKHVEMESRRLAEERGNPEYLFTAGRLSQVENSTSLPSLYKLATLSEVYHVSFLELLRLYGIEVSGNGHKRAESQPVHTAGSAHLDEPEMDRMHPANASPASTPYWKNR